MAHPNSQATEEAFSVMNEPCPARDLEWGLVCQLGNRPAQGYAQNLNLYATRL